MLSDGARSPGGHRTWGVRAVGRHLSQGAEVPCHVHTSHTHLATSASRSSSLSGTKTPCAAVHVTGVVTDITRAPVPRRSA